MRETASAAVAKPYHHGDLSRALVQAARRILENEGPAALSLRAVAREAGHRRNRVASRHRGVGPCTNGPGDRRRRSHAIVHSCPPRRRSGDRERARRQLFRGERREQEKARRMRNVDRNGHAGERRDDHPP